MDSAQVYRGMDIGTAKPDRHQRAQLPHHLIDIRDPAERYSAGEFVRDALGAAGEVHARGHQPVLVGGTMLYLRALYQGLAALRAPMRRCGARSMRRHGSRGGRRCTPSCRAWIRRPPRASHPPMRSASSARWRSGISPGGHQRVAAADRGGTRAFPLVALCTAARGGAAGRAALRQRLEMRLSNMLEAGFQEEVGRLYARGDLSEQTPPSAPWVTGSCGEFSAPVWRRAEARQAALTATAQLAKRQLTWLRREPDLVRLEAHAAGLAEGLAAQILAAAAHDRPVTG